MATILKTSDKNYPYIIREGWSGTIYCDLEDLLDLKKQIEKIEKKEKKTIDK